MESNESLVTIEDEGSEERELMDNLNAISTPKLTGIDFERICGYNPFMKDIFGRLVCSFCTLIPYEPLECRICNSVVCKPCLERWDRKDCIQRCGGFYESPSRILRDIINGVVIKCKNAEKGCTEQIAIERMKIHENDCNYDEIKCPFGECTYTDLRMNITNHVEKCEFNKIKCKFCKNSFKKSQFEEHLEKECEEVLVECEKCQKSERRKNLNKHDCINALKDEINDLQKTIKNFVDLNENLRSINDDLKKQIEEDKMLSNEKTQLMQLYINLLKSNYDNEDIRFKPYNVYNPIQIPFIFRFMTSSRSLQITNLAEYSFTKINLNIDFEIPTSHQSIVTSSKRIFIVGGVHHEKKTYEFDVLNKTLIERAEMNVGRRRHILTELRPGVFIASGGSNGNEEVLRECEAYLLSRNSWVRIASLNIPRFYHTAFSFNNNTLYVVGGCHTSNSSLVNLNTIERIELNYDLNGSWEVLSIKDLSLLKPRSRLSYLFITKDKLLLFGGIPDHQAVFYDLSKQEIFLADSQFNIEGRFFFNDRCTWQNESLFISSQSSRCIFNHSQNCWSLKEFNEELN